MIKIQEVLIRITLSSLNPISNVLKESFRYAGAHVWNALQHVLALQNTQSPEQLENNI